MISFLQPIDNIVLCILQNKNTPCQKTLKFVGKSGEEQDKNAHQMKGITIFRHFQWGTSTWFFVYPLHLLKARVYTPKESLNRENPRLGRNQQLHAVLRPSQPTAPTPKSSDRFHNSCVCQCAFCALFVLKIRLGTVRQCSTIFLGAIYHVFLSMNVQQYMRGSVGVLWFCVTEWANRPKSLLPIAGCEICETVVLLQFGIRAGLNG